MIYLKFSFDTILQLPGGPVDVTLYSSKSVHTLVFVPPSAALGFHGSPPPPSASTLFLSLIQAEVMYCCAVVASLAPDFSNCVKFKGDPAAFKSRARVSPPSCDQETSADSYIQLSEVPLDGPPCRFLFVPHPVSSLKGDYLSGCFFVIVFFVEPSRESKPPLLFEFLSLYLWCIFIYFLRNQRQLWSCVQGKFSSSPRLVSKLCFHRCRKELQF